MSQRVLFICTGNVCRSPMAEGMLRSMAEKIGAEIEVASAGVYASDGHLPSSNSVIAMQEEGIDISRQRSQLLTSDLVAKATHIFGMTLSHLEAVLDHFPGSQEKTFVLREFISDESLDFDVPDPIGGDLDEYRITRNLIKEAMPSVLRFVLTGDPAARPVAE